MAISRLVRDLAIPAALAKAHRWQCPVCVRLSALSLAILVIAGSGVPARGDVSGTVEKGRSLANELCAVCHLNPGQGEKTTPGTVPGFAAVAKRPGQTLDGIVAWLQSIPPMMPNHKLSQDEMEVLAFYILSLADEPQSR